MTTPRLGAPELVVAQDVPETTVNEQVRFCEQGATRFLVVDKDLATPPGSPSDGACYIVAGSPTGAWSGWGNRIAFYASGWKSIVAQEGMRAYVQDENAEYEYDGASWVAVAGLGTPDLDDLGDVNAPTPSNGDILTWDSTPGEWVATAPSSSITELDDVPDVNAPTPSNGDVLTWDSTPGEWVAQALPGAGAFVLNDATDVDTSGVADGDVLTYDSGGGEWVPSAPSGGSSFEASATIPTTSGYTLQNVGSATVTDTAHGLVLTAPPSGGSDIRFVRKNGSPPATPYSLIVRSRPIQPQSNTSVYKSCLVARNSTSGRIIIFGDYNSGQMLVQRWSGYTAFSANALAATTYWAMLAEPWLRMRNDGTNLIFGIGPDGVNFCDLHTEPLATYINASGGAVDEVGFGTMIGGAGFTNTVLFQSCTAA